MFSVILVIVPVAESVAATANPHQYIYLLLFFSLALDAGDWG
jgi:hypothetical protein